MQFKKKKMPLSYILCVGVFCFVLFLKDGSSGLEVNVNVFIYLFIWFPSCSKLPLAIA